MSEHDTIGHLNGLFYRVSSAWRLVHAVVFPGVLFLILLAVFTRRLALADSPLLGPFLVSLFGPLVLASIVMTLILLRSPYARIASKLGRERIDRTAGLGFIQATSGRVVLTRQKEYPFEGWWILPGGYINRQHDRYLQDTAARRSTILTNPKRPIVAGPGIATTNDSRYYRNLMLTIGHFPIVDEVFLIRPADGGKLTEDMIEETDRVRWFSRDDIASGVEKIPPHMREFLIAMVGTGGGNVVMRCWTPHSDFENYKLQLQVQQAEGQE